VTVAAVLAIAALLAPSAGGERAVQRGWYVRFGEDAWTYSPASDEIQPQRTRQATFLHLGDDGTALQLAVTVREDTGSRAGQPVLSGGDGFAVWSGTWKRADGGIEVELGFRMSSKVVFAAPPGVWKIAATLHGRHLQTPDGPLVPLGFAYPVDAASLRRQLFELCCSVPGRDPACRAVRR